MNRGCFSTSIFVGFLLLVTIQPTLVNAQTDQAVDREVEKMTLAENWAKIAEHLNWVDHRTLSPVRRILKAHACLFLNRNNEALCLFLSLLAESDLKQLEQWTQDFVKQHRKQAIAHYLRGDVLARLERWDDALVSFNTALKFSQNHPLVLNARGTVYAAKGQWDEALNDFFIATQVKPDFIEAYTSRGALWIQRKTGAPGALEALNQALQISPNPDYVLAFIGRGSVRTVLGEWDEAKKDFEKARLSSTNCLSVISEIINLDLTALLYEESEAVSKGLTEIAKVEPGMSIQKTIQAFSQLPPNEVSQVKGVLNFYRGHNQGFGAMAPHQMTSTINTNISGKVVGIIPVVGATLGTSTKATWNIRQDTVRNLNYQQRNLDLLNKMYPTIQPTTVGIIKGTLGGQQYWGVTHSAANGVTQKEVGRARIDSGNWNVVTVYGLLYSMKPTQL